MELSGKKMLVLGLGETGLSMAQWITRRGGVVRIADTRDRPPALDTLSATVPSAEVVTGPFSATLADEVDAIAVSPGVPLAEPVVAEATRRGVPIMGDIELFAQALAEHARPLVIAITGTNGKSTVTALVGAMCRSAGLDCEVAGNIGPAVLTALMRRLDADALPRVWVLELSSFQLETTYTLEPDVATVLNVTSDHLDRYPGMTEYAAAKARIFHGDGVQVLNRDDRYSMEMARPDREIVTFGLNPPRESHDFGLVKVFDEYWLTRGMTPLMAVREMRIAGFHNVANALAALALSRSIDCRCTQTLPALKTFAGLSHRVERVAAIDAVDYYDDSKGTNVGAASAALAGFARSLEATGGKVVLIAGGEGKQQDFGPLRTALLGAARAVVLIGRDAPVIQAALAGSGVPVERAGSMSEAVAAAARAARPGDVVLLSPACASFDMFENYQHRGKVFRAAVEELSRASAH
jgi:UDP-N-acetylmuramoylalanine--D-glutamate ligase